MVDGKTLIQCFSKDYSGNSRRYEQMPNCHLIPLLTLFTKVQKDHCRDKVNIFSGFFLIHNGRGTLSQLPWSFCSFMKDTLANALVSSISLYLILGKVVS